MVALQRIFSRPLGKVVTNMRLQKESTQILHAHYEDTLRPIEKWAAENGLRHKFEELGKHKLGYGRSYRYRLRISGFKGKGGSALLDELLKTIRGFKWQDETTGWAQEEVVEDDTDTTGRFAAATRR